MHLILLLIYVFNNDNNLYSVRSKEDKTIYSMILRLAF